MNRVGRSRVLPLALLGSAALVLGGCEEVPGERVHEHLEETRPLGVGGGGAPPDTGGDCQRPPAPAGGFTGQLERVRSYGTAGHQGAQEVATEADAVYVIGLLHEAGIDFGGGARLAQAGSYLARLDADGRGRWIRHFAHGDSDDLAMVEALATGPGRVAVTVSHSNGPLLVDGRPVLAAAPEPFTLFWATVLFDEAGRVLSAHPAGTSPPRSAFSADGTLYTVAGSRLIRRAPDGVLIAERELVRPAASPSFLPKVVKLDRQANVLLLAEYFGPHTVDGAALAADASGAGSVLMKLAPDGAPLWHRSFPGHAVWSDVVADSRGNVITLGRGAAAAAPFVLVDKRDPDGASIVQRRFPAHESLRSHVAIDPFDNIVLATFIEETSDFGGGPLRLNGVGDSGDPGEVGMAVVKLDPCGTHLWSRLVDDGYRNEWGRLIPYTPVVASDARGATIIVGTFRGSLDLAGERLRSRTPRENDAFFGRFAP